MSLGVYTRMKTGHKQTSASSFAGQEINRMQHKSNTVVIVDSYKLGCISYKNKIILKELSYI